MNKITFATLIFCLSSSASFAQAPQYSGGMKYTTMSAGEAQDTHKKPIYNRKPTQAAEEEAAEKTPEQSAQESAQESAWDKYKELAAGKGKASDTKEGSALPKAPDKPELPQKTAKKEQETPKAGSFASILENYQRNKEKRSQIRSISYEVPEELQIKKPEVDAPSVDAPKIEKPEVKKN